MRSRCLLAVLLLATTPCVLLGQKTKDIDTPTAHAQEKTPKSGVVEFKTADEIKVVATVHHPEKAESKTPAVVFIHQGGSSRQEWVNSNLWVKLAKQDYVLLAYDVRLHGQSGKDSGGIQDLFNNPKRSPHDLQAAIKFLRELESVDSTKIAVVGASIGANLACVAAADDQYGIKSAVSMSAKTSAIQNLSGTKGPVVPKNVFHIASKEEQGGMRAKWAKELHDRTTGKKKLAIADGDKHGSFILQTDQDLEQQIVDWLKETL